MSVQNYINHLAQYHQVMPKPVSSHQEVSWIPTIGIPIPTIGTGWQSGRQISIFSGDAEKIRQFVREDRDDQRQTSAALIGGLGAILFAGVSAYALKNTRNDLKELANAKIIYKNLTPQESAPLKPILLKHIEILEAKCARARYIALFAVSLLASASLAFAGGMFAVSWLITASIVSGVVFSAVGVFGLVWHYDDDYALPLVMQQELRGLLISR